MRQLETYRLNNVQSLISFKDYTLKEGRASISLFLNHVKQKAKCGINIKSEYLLEFFKKGEYLNIFQLGKKEDEIERKYNSAWADGNLYYPRLCAFLELFDKAKQAKYGSLNSGNLGLKLNAFGGGHTFIALKSDFSLGQNSNKLLYCLLTYSLSYFDDNGAFNETKFEREISNFDEIAELALLKHSTQIEGKSEIDFPDILASNFDVIEILLFGKITIDKIEEIRISRRSYEALMNSDFYSLSASRKYRYLNLQKVIEEAERLKIPVNLYNR